MRSAGPISERITIAWAVFVGLALLLTFTGLVLFFTVGRRTDPRYDDFSIDELIDAFETESINGMDDPKAAWVEPFGDDAIFKVGPFGPVEKLPNDLPEGLIDALGPAKPVRSPVMTAIVRRGLPALQTLIDHLSDSRKTATVVPRPKGFICFSDYYDARYPAKLVPRPGVNTEELDRSRVASYRVRVGDYCYVAIGQIVNRDLQAVEHRPAWHTVVTSPLERPALIEAVKKDWEGLTESEHQRCLMMDTFDKNRFRANGAIRRLHFYYPKFHESYVRQTRWLAVSTLMPDSAITLCARCSDFDHEVREAGPPFAKPR